MLQSTLGEQKLKSWDKMDSMLKGKYLMLGKITVKNPEADTWAYLLKELM